MVCTVDATEQYKGMITSWLVHFVFEVLGLDAAWVPLPPPLPLFALLLPLGLFVLTDEVGALLVAEEEEFWPTVLAILLGMLDDLAPPDVPTLLPVEALLLPFTEGLVVVGRGLATVRTLVAGIRFATNLRARLTMSGLLSSL